MSGINNDPFEEFEFKPINEGLGFHKKQKSNSDLTANPIAPKAEMKSSMNSTSAMPFQAPLPRNDAKIRQTRNIPSIEDDSIAKAQTAVNDILKNLNQKKQIDLMHEKEKQRLQYKKSKPQFFAAVLDGMLISSAFLLSLIVMLTVTKVDLFLNLSHPQTSRMIYFATAALFFAIHFIYMVVNRAFSGFTPGEWAFDQICGKQNQSEELSYIPKLIFRTLLVAATGFVILPFLSYLFNKDIAGEITGISLFQKPNA